MKPHQRSLGVVEHYANRPRPTATRPRQEAACGPARGAARSLLRWLTTDTGTLTAMALLFAIVAIIGLIAEGRTL